MTRIPSRAAAAGLLTSLALLLAGCGGSNTASVTHRHSSSGSGASGQTATTTSTPTTTSTATTPAPTTTTSTTTSTSSNSGGVGISGSACTAADLTPAFFNSNGATGHVVITFVLHNSGSTTCHTYGYPGVEFLTKSGAPITTDATRTTQDFAGRLPEAQITLSPGQEASFRMVTSDVASSQSACVTAYGLQIIAPDDTATMKATMPSGISVCNGKATVSPIVAGTGASST